MKELKICGEKIKNIESLSLELKKILLKDFDEKNSDNAELNLDLINDLFRGGYGVYEYNESVNVIWENSQISKNNLSFKETQRYYDLMIKKCHPENIKYVQNKIKLAQEGKGETLYDVVVALISNHKNVHLILK